MTNAAYIKRHLTLDGQVVFQDEIKRSGCVVVLAEPGAGKTELLKNLAESFNTDRTRANVFRTRPDVSRCEVLILDGLDEVAKIDLSAIDLIFAKASNMSPSLVVFACRASEWEAPRYKGLIKDYFGVEPTIYHLVAFSEAEQRSYFQGIAHDQSFDVFNVQASSLDLTPLFGNPLFLKLFTLAYMDNPHGFESKKNVFEGAILNLAKEHNLELPGNVRPSSAVLVNYGEEIFAKLLLSGSEGFSSQESHADQKFPFLFDLISKADGAQLRYLMDTGLFKLADNPSLHEPVHRIVAEYCAASYLAKRIRDNQDPLSLKRCLAIIAPNSTVRYELRGLIGWLAALGDKNTQELIIALDPYAVIANGDPAQLHSSSKVILIKALSDLAKKDPYFRANDKWRSFSAKGFFTQEVVDATINILTVPDNKNHLRALILELLENSDQIHLFKAALIELLVNVAESEHIRKLAINCLINIASEDLSSTFDTLVGLGDSSSLELASVIIERRGVEYIGRLATSSFLKILSSLYPDVHQQLENVIGKRYFIKVLIDSFSENDTQWFLDELSSQMKCRCLAKHDYDCTCRLGLSKVAGLLLDRYFEMKIDQFDPGHLWQWMRNLIFQHSIASSQSKSVEVLQNNDKLRQSIQLLALTSTNDTDDLWALQIKLNGHMGHSGLSLREGDIKSLVQSAYADGNFNIWGCYFQHHLLYSKERCANELRALMRQHAHDKPEFMVKWAGARKHEKDGVKKAKADNYRYHRKYKAINDRRKKKNSDDFNANKELIKNGMHWGWVEYLSGYYLYHDKNKNDFEIVPDDELIETSLCNSINFIESDLPSLQKLAELRINNQEMRVERILCAAAVCTYRKWGALTNLSQAALVVLKVALNRYSANLDDEYNVIDDEVSRCLFLEENDRETFVRNYFEPQLASLDAKHISIEWLNTRLEFNQFKKTLPFEWLNRYSSMPLHSMETLFAYCVSDFDDRNELTQLITARCEERRGFQYGPPTEEWLLQRTFWFVRYFYFIETECPAYIWAYLISDPKNLFLFETYSGRWSRDESEGWPPLSANKLYQLLDAFTPHWPEIDLPSSHGTESPRNERAYRFLSNLVSKIANDIPEKSLPVLNQLINESKLSSFRQDALHLRAGINRKLALRDFVVSSASKIIEFFDDYQVASVEDLRAMLLEKLEELQKYIQSAETDPLDVYYPAGKRVDENTARNRIVEFLQPRFSGLDVISGVEQHMAAGNRCDITATISLNGKQHLLVVELKGQWNKELYTAATEQLHKRYSSHPNAAEQGIYLVLWFGSDEKVADRVAHGIETPQQLKGKILEELPAELRGKIDVFVLNLSRPNSVLKPVKKRKPTTKK